MRRFATILYHRKAGFTANVMVVWKVLEESSEEIGVDEYDFLYSTREFKKVRINYFSPEFERWERDFLVK